MNRVELTEGPIFKGLFRLSLPLMATSFIQIAYNLTDTLWLGRLSAGAMASAGTSALLLWLATALIAITRVGAGVGVAQSIGAKNRKRAISYAYHGMVLNGLICLGFSLILWFGRWEIIGFFQLNSPEIIANAISYLKIITVGLVFFFFNPILAAILNYEGDSVTPFHINTVGLVLNIFMDPLLIFGWGPVPALGVMGAAYATVMAQGVVFLLFIIIGYRKKVLYTEIPWGTTLNPAVFRHIAQVGVPLFFQIGGHCAVSMVLTRMVAGFGDIPVAVFAGGQQIESVSWMTADGIGVAIAAFIGQNFGAGKRERLRISYRYSMLYIGFFGLLGSLIMVLGSRGIMGVFFPHDPLAVVEGTSYLRIVGISHIFMNLEIGAEGAFNGIGRSVYGATVGLIFNLLRIPMSLWLISYAGVRGIWLAISICTIMKGLVAWGLFRPVLNRIPAGQWVE